MLMLPAQCNAQFPGFLSDMTFRSISVPKNDLEDRDFQLTLPPSYFHNPPRRPLTRSTSNQAKSSPPPTETPSSPMKLEKTGSCKFDEISPDSFSGLQIITAVIAEPVDPTTIYCVTPRFKLPTSKSPIMEAMVYCALHKWGIEISHNDKASQRIVFKVTDFENYYKLSCSICSKQTPSEDIRSRMKALQRWFTSFPSRKDLGHPFSLTVKLRQFRKVREIIDKVTKLKAAVALPVPQNFLPEENSSM